MRNKNKIEIAIKDPSFNWLGRKVFIEEFSEYILSQKESTHVCINGVWGSGKTTTVLGIIDHINNGKNDNEKPLILYLDAWKYEHYDHPLFSLLKVMEDSSPQIIAKIKSEFKKMSFEPQIGLNVPLFNLSIYPGKGSHQRNILNLAEYIDALNKLMIKAIKSYKEEKGNQLIIFIDELDRAKPDFVLRTIEMFHHIQDELPTHVVYSVDMSQLNSIIKHYYGYEYNVEVFVHKVFETIIPLSKISKQDIQKYITEQFSIDNFKFSKEKVADKLIYYLSSEQVESLRTINRLCQKTINNLNMRYFNADPNGFIRSEYYLGSNRYNIWGYVEILILLQVMSLSDPLLSRRNVKGRDIDKLLDYILSFGDKEEATDLFNLVYESFIFNLEKDEIHKKSILEMTKEDMIIGLQRIFLPPMSNYNNISVFEDINLG